MRRQQHLPDWAGKRRKGVSVPLFGSSNISSRTGQQISNLIQAFPLDSRPLPFKLPQLENQKTTLNVKRNLS